MNATGSLHFGVFMLVSLVAFLGILRLALRKRPVQPGAFQTAWVSILVVVGGMLFARFAAASRLPPTVYYGIPAALTLLLPPVVFRMRLREFAGYGLAAAVTSPAIHLLFSLFLGWNEYLPFWQVPSLRELLW